MLPITFMYAACADIDIRNVKHLSSIVCYTGMWYINTPYTRTIS